jgi:uncharacterized protein YukE
MTEPNLVVTLNEYSKQLAEHLAMLREKRQELETAWIRLREIYEGEGARAFGEAFESASARLSQYNDLSDRLSQRLREKIAELQRFEGSHDNE